MAMKGIGQIDLYQTYQVNRAQEQDALRLGTQNQEQVRGEEKAPEDAKELSLSLNLDGLKAKHNMSLTDVSLTMQQPSSTSFEMKALSFQPEQDDMNKAVSDLQKDSALMQYSYFVGESNVITDNEDCVVLLKPHVE